MSELWRWIDPRVESVRLPELRSYLLAHGWKLKSYPQPQVLVFEEPVAGNEEPIVQLVPVSDQVREFRRSVIDVITSLSAVENRHPAAILDDILREAEPGRPTSPPLPGAGGELAASADSGQVPSR